MTDANANNETDQVPRASERGAVCIATSLSRAADAPSEFGRQEPRGGYGGNFSSRVELILEEALRYARTHGSAYSTRVKRPGCFGAPGFPAEH